MIVGYHAPPSSAPTGVADYARTLAGELRKFGTITPGARHADVHLYHIGNNALHASIYERALLTPGVIVLHDAVLHHFLLGGLTHDQYINEWVYNYGEWRRDLGEELWRERASSATDPRYFRFAMLRRLIERSRSIIVHNPGAAAIVHAHGAKDSRVIPHFFRWPKAADDLSAARFRESLQIGHGTFLFGMFGYLRETKRVLPSVRAFKKLHAARTKTALLLAGEVVSADLEKVLRMDGQHPAIYRLGRLNAHDFEAATAAVDCCVNLRYPSAGETSGISIHAMGIGKPVIVTCNEENRDLPETGCLRVRPGVAEEAELFEHMSLVTEFPEVARRIGREAARYIQERHNLESVAAQYWEALCAAIS